MSFADVAADQWYTEVIRWAQSTGVVTGYDADTFGPNDDVTREQLAAENVQWANAVGIVNGRTDTTIAPTGNATRAEAAYNGSRYPDHSLKKLSEWAKTKVSPFK